MVRDAVTAVFTNGCYKTKTPTVLLNPLLFDY